jgi:hypothetical protein
MDDAMRSSQDEGKISLILSFFLAAIKGWTHCNRIVPDIGRSHSSLHRATHPVTCSIRHKTAQNIPENWGIGQRTVPLQRRKTKEIRKRT